MDLLIGSHVSFKKDTQLLGSAMEAYSYGENTFMFYTGAPQNTSRSELDANLTKQAYEYMEQHGIHKDQIIVHAPYIINLANPTNQDFAIRFLKQEIVRCEELGMTKLVLHPGSSVKLSREEGIQNIIDALNQVLTKEQTVSILLETMAGKGTELGITFEEIKQIIDGVKFNEHLSVCLDTCHINDAGYDLSHFDEVLEEFDRIIGLERLGCIHVNDSKNERGAHKDRHANIGYGTIGFEQLLHVIYHEKLKEVPKILETPYVGLTWEDKKRLYPPYRFEIEMILKKQFNPNLLADIVSYYKKD